MSDECQCKQCACVASPSRTMMYLVGDGAEDVYGVFSTRDKAQRWIRRQHKRGASYCQFEIYEWPLNNPRNLYRPSEVLRTAEVHGRYATDGLCLCEDCKRARVWSVTHPWIQAVRARRKAAGAW